MRVAGRVLNAAAGKSILLIALTLCACSCSKPEQKARYSTAQAVDDGLPPELKAALNKEFPADIARVLAEGPTSDRMPEHVRTNLVTRFGPPLPQVSYAAIRKFLPEKLAGASMVALIPNDAMGFPTLLAEYQGEFGAKKSTVYVWIRDQRLTNGGLDVDIEEKRLSKSQHRPGLDREKGSVGRFTSYINPDRWVMVVVGRFTVQVEMRKDYDMKVVQQFFDVIDFEKLSQVN